jgi:hypothetical protein
MTIFDIEDEGKKMPFLVIGNEEREYEGGVGFIF